MATQKTPRIDPLTLEVVDLIGTVVARYHEEYEEAAAEHALTGAQARLLSLLSLEPLPMRRLAQQLKCEPSNVTGIVDRLEVRGLVERRPDPADRRVKLAAVTEEGLRVARSLRDSLRFAREPLAGLSREERVSLRGLLLRMLAARAGGGVFCPPPPLPVPCFLGLRPRPRSSNAGGVILPRPALKIFCRLVEIPARPAFEDEAVQADSGGLGAASPQERDGKGRRGVNKPLRAPPQELAARLRR